MCGLWGNVNDETETNTEAEDQVIFAGAVHNKTHLQLAVGSGGKPRHGSRDLNRKGDDMKAFLIQWSEGDPVLVLASSFASAVETFSHEMADEGQVARDVLQWIESVTLIAENIITEK